MRMAPSVFLGYFIYIFSSSRRRLLLRVCSSLPSINRKLSGFLPLSFLAGKHSNGLHSHHLARSAPKHVVAPLPTSPQHHHRLAGKSIILRRIDTSEPPSFDESEHGRGPGCAGKPRPRQAVSPLGLSLIRESGVPSPLPCHRSYCSLSPSETVPLSFASCGAFRSVLGRSFLADADA